MPKEFDECVRKGGRVRRKTLKDEKYVNICYRDGRVYRGHVKRKKGKKS